MNLVLWIVQGLLAVSCVVSCVLKAFRPLATVSRLFPWTSHVPAALVRVIGGSRTVGWDRTGSAFGTLDPPVVDGRSGDHHGTRRKATTQAMISSMTIPVQAGQAVHIQQLWDEHHHWQPPPLSRLACAVKQ